MNQSHYIEVYYSWMTPDRYAFHSFYVIDKLL